ncbi:MAG: hypothetical protein IKH80_02535 [Bacteroidaceae bacterium]|nr:hypothetical protein [Bacteroidaceae bacterium]
MKTSNIRYAAILLATLMSLNMSAQKNVLKQFEKLKTAKGVTVTNSSREQGMEDENQALSWRCNVVEFKASKVYGASLMMKELQAAFEEDSQDPDVTYFGEMKGLSERATDEERAKYKKTIVRYNAKDDPIVLGANTTYNVLVLRCKSGRVNHRIVVATEWKMDAQNNVVGSLYEIEGPNDFVRTATASAADEEADLMEVDTLTADMEDVGRIDFITRMTFYRDNFTLMYNPSNSALMTDMFNFVRARADELTANERSVGRAILDEMAGDRAVSAAALSYLRMIDYCKGVLTPNGGALDERLVLERLDSYFQEWRKETVYNEQMKIFNRMAEYIRAQQEKGLSENTFNRVVKFLGNWKSSCTVYTQKEFISSLLTSMEKKQNGTQ